MPLFVTMLVDSVGAACYGRLAQYTPSLLDRHAGSAKTEKLLRARPFSYGGSQCFDHETGKIRCIQTDAAITDQSTKCSSAGVR